MLHSLVIGGTGPSGRSIMNGLIARGHQVSVLHTGLHETELPAEVEHIHTDPHVAETLAPALAGRRFDSKSVEWTATHPIARDSEIERRTGDQFDYELEDQPAQIDRAANGEPDRLLPPAAERAHMYRHPLKPFEAWTDPSTAQPA